MDKVYELHLTRAEIEAVGAALEHMADDIQRNRRVMAETVIDAADDAVSTATTKARLLLAYAEAESQRVKAYNEYREAVYGKDRPLPWEEDE